MTIASISPSGPLQGCKPRSRARVRGGSVVGPLVVLSTTALMGVIAQFALFAPNARIAETLQSLSLPVISEPPERSYGACGDVCNGRRCRHVVLRDGLHDGSRVSNEVLEAAESCH